MSTLNLDYLNYTYQEKTWSHNDIAISYIDEGSSDLVLVFVHGMGASLKEWEECIASLKESYRCIALDLPGHGKSVLVDFDFSITNYSELLSGFITSLGLKDIILVGHSMGGLVSTHYTNGHQDIVKKLLLLAPAGIEVYKKEEVAMIEMVFEPRFIEAYPDEQIIQNFKLNFHTWKEAYHFLIEDRLKLKADKVAFPLYCKTVSQCAISIVKNPSKTFVKDFKTPTIIIYGESDNIIPHHLVHPNMKLADVAADGQKLLNAELIMLPECGHNIQLEKTAEVVRVIKGWLED